VSADQEVRQFPWLEALQVRARVIDQAEAYLIGGDLPVEQPPLRLADGEDLGEEVMQFHDLDTAVAHLADEVEVIAAGILHPDHVEQQVVAVRRGQALMGQPRSADQDLPQLADFGMHAVPVGRRRGGVSHSVLPRQQSHRSPGRRSRPWPWPR
jgi:hypothetical protein